MYIIHLHNIYIRLYLNVGNLEIMEKWWDFMACIWGCNENRMGTSG